MTNAWPRSGGLAVGRVSAVGSGGRTRAENVSVLRTKRNLRRLLTLGRLARSGV